MLHRVKTSAVLWLACWGPACTGQIDGVGLEGSADEGNQDGNRPGNGSQGQPGSGVEDGTPGASKPAQLPWPASFDGEPSVLRRLSRDEIVTTMKLLVGAAPPRADLPGDHRATPHTQHTNTGAALIAQEVEKLVLGIDAVSAQAGTTGLARSGCKSTGQAQRDCLGGHAVGVAEKAFRRPLSAAEGTRLKSIFAAAGTSAADDTESVAQMVRAIFLSASFLYRGETGTSIDSRPDARLLAGGDVAVRLAFLATLAPPDAMLLEAAREGALSDPDERARHLDRLLATDQGELAMAAFVLEHLGGSESYVKEKSAKYQEGLPADYDTLVRASAVDGIRAALSGAGTINLAAVLTSDAWLADAAVASVRQSGPAKPPDGGNKRVGMLMHPYVLASHTKDNGVSPFTIGIFLRESLLCEDVPPAPANAAMMARTDPPAGMSIREELVFRTNASPACAGCHSTFAPMGFAFLPFDPVGRWVDQDPTGKPWDLAGQVATSRGEPLVFDGPADLVQALAERPQVHGCFAQAALTWAFGRRPVPADRPLLASLAETSLRTRGGVPELFRALVTSPDFLNVVVTR
jgi:hypothetical protein